MITEPIVGKYVILKIAEVSDAEFTLQLRTDPKLTKYIPKIQNTIEQQRAWIQSSRARDDEYFFVVWTVDGERIGTISVFNIRGTLAEGGRLVLIGNGLENFEAAMLLSDFSFNELGLSKITGFIFPENKRSIRFNKKMGNVVGPPEKDDKLGMICKSYTTRELYVEARKELCKLLYNDEKTSGKE